MMFDKTELEWILGKFTFDLMVLREDDRTVDTDDDVVLHTSVIEKCTNLLKECEGR